MICISRPMTMDSTFWGTGVTVTAIDQRKRAEQAEFTQGVKRRVGSKSAVQDHKLVANSFPPQR